MTLYGKLLTNAETDDEGGYDAVADSPPHIMKARQAAMLLQGGYGLEKDPNRAGKYKNQRYPCK